MKFGKAKNPVERHLDGASKAKHTNGTSDSTASSTGINWGATPDDWHHFDRVLGLGGDLLPVVSNPDAPISPDSTMTALGKTPSRYDSRQRVIGIRDWPTMEISGQSLARWSREPDFGICIRTTSVRGLDVDFSPSPAPLETLNFRVENTLADDNSEMSVNLKFKSMEDFEPGQVVEQVPALQKLLEMRNKLRDLKSYVEKSKGGEKLLEQILQDMDKVRSLAGNPVDDSSNS